MHELDELVGTLEVIRDAVDAKNKEKAFEAATIFLLQFIDVFGHSNDFMKRMFPSLEQLKNLIQSEQYDDAMPLVFALLIHLRGASKSLRA